MIARAKENIKASGLEGNYVRFIAEDCMKFVEREIRRGRKYDGIIMDPPTAEVPRANYGNLKTLSMTWLSSALT